VFVENSCALSLLNLFLPLGQKHVRKELNSDEKLNNGKQWQTVIYIINFQSKHKTQKYKIAINL
jgi:hypothetical protein